MARSGVSIRRTGLALVLTGAFAFFLALPASGQIFSNLQSLVYQLRVGDPGLQNEADGPKSIASADLDLDGFEDLAVSNTDGSVTVFHGKGNGRFNPAIHLRTGARALRGVTCADLSGDGLPDIVVAAPFSGKIYWFENLGGRAFGSVREIPAWSGVRSVLGFDFDGDGRLDLAAAGPKKGIQQLMNIGGGSFLQTASVPALNYTFADPNKFPKPFYAMTTFQPASANRQFLLATHAETNRVWMLTPNAAGTLEIYATFTNRSKAHGMALGALTRPASLGIPDLVSVAHDAGVLEIHAGLAGPPYFESGVVQRIDIPGGPRWAQVVDLNQDGWNDLVVAQRELGSIVTYVNSNGVFRLASERPVGVSPREMIARRLDEDAFPDLAVMNRASADVSVLLAYPEEAGYRGINHLYLVDGNVAALSVYDFNQDGRDDVIQLHRSSGDFSVRLANPDGTLQSPVYYTVGNVPTAQVFADVNNDGFRDQITANLGSPFVEKGSVSVRLGNGDGTFGSEQRLNLPAGIEGRLFAIVPADFDGDGNIDLAAGFLDGSIAFFQGHGDGSLSFGRAHPFSDQARAMAAGDFDHDGDIDLLVAGMNGRISVIENEGDLLESIELQIHVTPAPSLDNGAVRTAVLTDQDQDGNLDVVVGSGSGAWIYRGTGGLVFSTPPEEIATLSHAVSGLLLADLDNDGKRDLAIACRDLDCISVFTPQEGGGFAFAASMEAPASRFLASGDLDGDGKADLVGSGRILWTALSSHSPQTTPPLNFTGQRGRQRAIVINEILAANDAIPADGDDGRTVEWVELFNGGDTSQSLNGWKLRSIGPDKTGSWVTNDFTFPPAAFFSPGKHPVVYYSETKRTAYHTGFKLPTSGSLVLLNSAGAEIDRLDYPEQRDNVSYGRYRDGIHSFVYSSFPSEGKPNNASGLIEPTIKFTGIDPESLVPGRPTRFYAQAEAQVGVSSMVMYYQRLDAPNSGIQQVSLFDDGQHGDGAASDGWFGGEILSSLPWGAEIQFFFEVTDLDDQVVTTPDEPEFGIPGMPGNVFQLAIRSNLPPLEISEVVPLNETGLMDEHGGHPDWVEVRNTSGLPLRMDGVSLAQQIDEKARFYWPAGTWLQPGEHVVVFCDNKPEQGPWHAPLRLSASGDMVMLLGQSTNKSPFLIDWVQFGAVAPDTAWARMGPRAGWCKLTPTPSNMNFPEAGTLLLQTNSGTVFFLLGFGTKTNVVYTIERSDAVTAAQWTTLEPVQGDGFEKVHKEPMGPSRFFRVKRMPKP